MGWFKVDGHSAFHAKVLAAGNAAWGAFIRMGAYSTENFTDGFISREVAMAIASKQELARLQSVRLVEDEGDGYRIHDFHEYNPSAEAARAKLAEKKAKKVTAGRLGAAKRWGTNNGTSDGRPIADAIANECRTDGPDPDPEIKDPSLVSSPADREHAEPGESKAIPRSIARLEAPAWIAAYERACQQASRNLEWSFPRAQIGILEQLLSRLATGDYRANFSRWIDEWVPRFVKSVRDAEGDRHQPAMWSAYAPKGLLRWFNEGKPGLAKTLPPSEPWLPEAFDGPPVTSEQVEEFEAMLGRLREGEA